MVVDATGEPIVGALRAITVPCDNAARTWLTLSADDGRFAFDGAPAVPGARLTTQHPDWELDDRPLPPVASQGLVVRLGDQPREEPVRGTVFGPDGGPIVAASVRVGAADTVTGADGTFSLVVPAGESGDAPLLVYATGLQPTRVDGWHSRDGRPAGELTVLLKGAEPLRGRVVDARVVTRTIVVQETGLALDDDATDRADRDRSRTPLFGNSHFLDVGPAPRTANDPQTNQGDRSI